MSEEATQNLPQDGVRLILARLDPIDSRLDNVEGQLVRFGGRTDGFEKRPGDFGSELRSSLRSFERQVGLLAEDVMKVRADQRGLEKRMDEFKSKAT